MAHLVRRIVSNLLAAVGVDRLGDQMGAGQVLGAMRLSGLLGLVVYVLILFPGLISSLNALQLAAITKPASDMLGTILDVLTGGLKPAGPPLDCPARAVPTSPAARRRALSNSAVADSVAR